MKKIMTRSVAAALTLACLVAQARADYVSQTYQLDQSNIRGSGTTWGSARIEAYDGNGTAGGGLAAGQVRITLQADAIPAYEWTGKHFGIDGVGFNTNLSLKRDQISAPAHWMLHAGRLMGGFGQFAWEAVGRVRASHNPLVITVSGLGTNATVDHFLIPSTNAAGGVPVHGSVLFAARIGGFEMDRRHGDARTQVVGNGYPTPPPTTQPVTPTDGGSNTPPPVVSGTPPPAASPEPCTLVLCAVGAGGLSLGRWLKRRRTTR